MKTEDSTTVNTTVNGLNIGGYAGPRLATAHELRLYRAAVASAPWTNNVVQVCFQCIEFISCPQIFFLKK
jgi:hypothetical protein